MDLRNKGIFCKSFPHGKEIINFFINNGVRSNGYTGNAVGFVYYVDEENNVCVNSPKRIEKSSLTLDMIDVDYTDNEVKNGDLVQGSFNNKDWSQSTFNYVGKNPMPETNYAHFVINIKSGIPTLYPYVRKYVKPKIDFQPEINTLLARIEAEGQKTHDYTYILRK